MSEALTDVAANTPSPDVADTLAALVGEGKKYKDVQALAKGYLNADIHINELRTTIDELKRDNVSTAEVIAEIRRTARVENEHASGTPPVASAPTISADDITKIVEDTLSVKERDAKAEAIQQQSIAKLVEHYGSHSAAMTAIKSIITKSPNSKSVIDQLGQTDPDMLFALVTSQALKSDALPNVPGAGGAQDVNILPGSSSLTWKQCQEVRRKNPALYRSKEFRAKMEHAAATYAREGKDFYVT